MRLFLHPLLLVIALAPCTAAARDGDLDLSFGFFGKNRIAAAGSSFIAGFTAAAAIQPDGKILLAGTKYTVVAGYYDYDMCVVRLNDDGTPDTSFGGDGEVDVALNRGGNNDDEARDVVLQQDGKILLVGVSEGDPTTENDIAVVRLNTDGTVDSTYGANGVAIVPFNLGAPTYVNDSSAAGFLDSQGRLLVTGVSDAGSTSDYAVATVVRLDTTGARDTSFSADGRATFGSATMQASALRIRETMSHKIIVAGLVGEDNNTNADMLVLRYNVDGTPDTTFGSNGVATYGFDIGGSLADVAADMAELPDGSILVAGAATINAPFNSDVAVVKFTPSGAIAADFAPRTYPIDIGGDFQDTASRIHIDSQGRILLAGQASIGTNGSLNLTNFLTMRLLPDGSLDPQFGTNGRVIYSGALLFQSNLENTGTSMAVDAHDRIVIAGTAAYNSANLDQQQFVVMRMFGDTIFSNAFE